MSFLLGAFGKLAAGRRCRDLKARMMRVQTRLRRATRQTATMSKMIETQKKMELNQLTAQASWANSMMPAAIRGAMAQGPNGVNLTDDQFNLFTGAGGANWNNDGSMDADTQKLYGVWNQFQTQIKARNEMTLAQLKNQIEEKYENMNDYLLEPLKQEEESLQTEKDSLESQLQIAQADYDACKQMEKADAKNLKPEYTAG